MNLSPTVERLIDFALEEDLSGGDITTDAIFSGHETTVAEVVCRQPMVVSGLIVAQRVMEKVDPDVHCQFLVLDGDTLVANTPLVRLSGKTVSILKAERLMLNFLQHLSGVATLTYQFAGAAGQTQIAHTRKTLPGLRELEIQAVLDGNGVKHRASLSDAVLIKDNHIQAAGGLPEVVNRVRHTHGDRYPIQVECDTLEQVEIAVSLNVNRILLDNMTLTELKGAVQLVKQSQKPILLEASGGVHLNNVMAIAQTGVDIISTSQLTLSAPAVDIGLDFLPVTAQEKTPLSFSVTGG